MTRNALVVPLAVLLLAACKPAAPDATAPADPAAAVPPPTAAEPAAAEPAAPTAAIADPAGDRYPAARDACIAAVARQTNVEASRLVATEVLWAEAGVGVTIAVPGAQAPWSCLSDEKGKVQGAMYTGSEGGA